MVATAGESLSFAIGRAVAEAGGAAGAAALAGSSGIPSCHRVRTNPASTAKVMATTSATVLRLRLAFCTCDCPFSLDFQCLPLGAIEVPRHSGRLSFVTSQYAQGINDQEALDVPACRSRTVTACEGMMEPWRPSTTGFRVHRPRIVEG